MSTDSRGVNIFAERQKLANIVADCWGAPVTARARTLAHVRLVDTFIPDAGLSADAEAALYGEMMPLFVDVATRRTGWEDLEYKVSNLLSEHVYEPLREALSKEFNAQIKSRPDRTIQQLIDTLVGDEVADFRRRNSGVSPGDELAFLCRYSPRFDMVSQLIAELAGGIPDACVTWWPSEEPLWFDCGGWD